MEFLNPLFLALGLGALAVPVAIHLLFRRRSKVIPFSTLRFLIAVERRTAHRNRLRAWLLLLLRMAALLLLALALAHPSTRDSALPGTRPACARIVIVDDSASMNRRALGRSPFDLARETAAMLLASLSPGDQADLLLLSDAQSGTEPALTGPRDLLLSGLEGLRPGHGTSEAERAFDAAVACLTASNLPRKELIFLTDFPGRTWDGLVQKISATALAPLRDGSIRTVILVPTPPEGANGSLHEASALPGMGHGPDRCRIRVLLRNGGTRPLEGRLTLTVDQDRIEARPVRLAPFSEQEQVIEFKPPRSGPHRGMAALNPDLLLDDNARFFLFEARPSRRVLLIAGKDRGNPYEDPSFYIARALAPPIGPGGQDAVRLVQEGAAYLDGGPLDDFDAVILVDPRLPSPRAGKALKDYVEQGGGLMVLMGSGKYDPESLDGLVGILPPGPWAWRSLDAGASGFRMEPSLPGHPLLAALRAMHPPADLGAPRFKGYLERRSLGGKDESQTILLRFTAPPSPSDGAQVADPALLERRFGRGRVLVFLNDCAPASGDFAFKVSFVPFLHKALAHLCHPGRESISGMVGDPLPDREESPDQEDDESWFFAPSPDALLEPVVPAAGGRGSNRALRMNRPGFYVRPCTSSPGTGDGGMEWLPANVDAAESDWTPCPIEEAGRRLHHGLAAAFDTPEEALALLAPIHEAGTDLFRPLLLAGLLLLVLEPFLANRRSIRERASKGRPWAAAAAPSKEAVR